MSTSLDIDIAMHLASEAFSPYRCNAHQNGDDSFTLSVRNSDGGEVLNIPKVPRTQYSQPLRLVGVIEQARLDLTHKGCQLEPWAMPFIPDPSGLPETPPIY
jgi:hypothetical protein